MTWDDLKLLGCQTRWQLLEALALEKKPTMSSILCARVSMQPSVVSHHLKLLRLGGYVEKLTAGKYSFWFIRIEKLKELQTDLKNLESGAFTPGEVVRIHMTTETETKDDVSKKERKEND